MDITTPLAMLTFLMKDEKVYSLPHLVGVHAHERVGLERVQQGGVKVLRRRGEMGVKDTGRS